MNKNSQRPPPEPESACAVADEDDWLDDSPFPYHPRITRISFKDPWDKTYTSDGHQPLLPFVYALRTAVLSCQDQGGKYRYTPLRSTAARARRHRHMSLIIKVGGELYTNALIIQPNETFTSVRKALLSFLADDSFFWPSQLWRIPGEGLAAARELRRYCDNMVRSVKSYRDKLIERAIVDNPTRFRGVDLLSCPICSSPLRCCSLCDVPQVCSSDECAAASLDDTLSCTLHDERFYCHDCVKNAESGCAPLAKCPFCDEWYCPEDLSWYLGSPAPFTNDSGDSRIHALKSYQESGWHAVPRSHPPMPGPCGRCVLWGHPDKWFQCENIDKVDSNCPYWHGHLKRHPSGPEMRSKICSECAPADPLICRCDEVKYCGTCADTEYVPHLGACPRCRTPYCLRFCDYINKCSHCCKSTLCLDCMEEEDVNGGEESAHSSVLIIGKCNGCGRSICRACVDDRVMDLCRDHLQKTDTRHTI